MMISTWLWIAAGVAFSVLELVTSGLVSIWFVAGAAAAMVSSLLGLPVAGQLVTFAVVSAAAMAVLRPIAKRWIDQRPAVPTNADRLLGQTARVTEAVDNGAGTGAVYADGKTWTARSVDGAVFPAGATIRIEKIEGVKLLVKQSEKEEEVKR